MPIFVCLKEICFPAGYVSIQYATWRVQIVDIRCGFSTGCSNNRHSMRVTFNRRPKARVGSVISARLRCN